MFMIDILIVSFVEVSIHLGYDATLLGIWLLTFWNHYIVLKQQQPNTQWCSVISRRNRYLIYTTVRNLEALPLGYIFMQLHRLC